ncbi:PHP domain-containing protein [Ihubacter sp. rT4E-8]|uniref:PHP domain-containing protein n=1 Tax=unclassified Ihubacter TaxID=2633299 RepID=UPI003C7DA843
MNYKSDYHIHTWYSDGTMKPTAVVRRYKDREYDMIAITDHDGVDGIKEAEIAGEALEIKVIPGVELGTAYDLDGKALELHILGYYIDTENKALTDTLCWAREQRNARNEKLLAYLNNLGYALSKADLFQRPEQTYVGKPDFVRALAAKGYDIADVWSLLDGVKREMMPSSKAIEVIKSAGGIAVLAHPMKTKDLPPRDTDAFWQALDAIVRDLKKCGLGGLECYHPSASEDESLKLVILAGKYHLHITEGSDFHGDK